MHIATTVEQNYMYTAGATEMGRGERSNPFPLLNTPGPGAYNIYKEVKEPRTRTKSPKEDVKEEELKKKIAKIPKYPWGGKVMTILEKKQDKEEERVDIDMYKEVPTWNPTKDWALQRLDENEKARDQPQGWT
jgi:hypothetical protein